jgi:hypothetical protein
MGKYDYPLGYVYMNFFGSSLEINNLGGYCDARMDGGCIDKSGPEFDLPDDGRERWVRQQYDRTQSILYYKNIGTIREVNCVPSSGKPCTPKRLDLKVEVAADSAYHPNNAENLNGWGKSRKFGQINMGGREGAREAGADGDMSEANPNANEATLIFTLMDQRTRTPYEGEVTFFSFTYFDFDKARADNGGQECVEILEPAVDRYDYTAGNSVDVSDGASGKRFCATNVGFREDNPEKPSDAAPDPSLARAEVVAQAVTLEFRNTSMM